MTGILFAKSLSEYDVIEVTPHAGDRQVIARWMLDAGIISQDEWSVETAKNLAHDLDQMPGAFVVRERESKQVIITDPDTFERSFSVQSDDSDPLASLDAELDTIEIPEEIRARGSFETEEQWQWFGIDAKFSDNADWWDGVNEDYCRTQAALYDADKPKVRRRTEMVARGPWTVV